MKLPKINYQAPVQSLGRHDTGAPIRVAEAKRKVAESAGRLVNEIGRFAQDYSLNKSKMKVKEDMASFEARNEGKHFYTEEELINSGDQDLIDISRGRDNIPASEVFPALYEKAYKESIANNRGPLVGRWSRNFDQTVEMDMLNSTSRITAKAMSDISKEQDAETKVDIQDAVAEGNIEQAIGYVGMINSADYDKEAMISSLRNTERVLYVDKLLLDEDVNTITAERDRLNEVEYDTRFVNIAEQRKQRDRLDAWLNNFDTASNSWRKTSAVNLKAMMRKMAANVHDGHDANANDVTYVRDALVGFTEEEIPTHLRDTYYDALKSYTTAESKREMTYSDAESAQTKLREGMGDFRTEESNRKAIKIIANQNKRKKEDGIGYYNEGNNPTIPAVTLSGGVENFQKAWKSRYENDANMVNDKYRTGEKGFRYFSDHEIRDITATLNAQKNPDAMIDFSQMLYEVSGRDTANAIEELRSRGELDPRFATIGSLVSRSPLNADGVPTVDTARNLIEGAKLRAEHKWVIPKDEWRDSFVDKMYPKFNSAYTGSNAHRSAMMDSVLDYYAYLNKGDIENFNDELIDKAIDAVTGGLVDWGSSTVEAPVDERLGRTINQAEYNTWAKSMHPDEIAHNGGAANYSDQELVDLIRSEDATFETSGPNTMYVKTAGGYIRDNEGGRFEIKYRSDFIQDMDETLNWASKLMKPATNKPFDATQYMRDLSKKNREKEEAAAASRAKRSTRKRGPRK